MKFSYELKVEQTQKLIMTPELRQAINILQLTTMELKNLIENEIENNPILDIQEERDDFDWVKSIRFDRKIDEEAEPDDDISFENYAPIRPSLRENLLFQLGLLKLPKVYLRVCKYIIHSLDESGYLIPKVEEIAEELNTPVDVVLKALKIIQGLEPAGVGARDLKECLLIQLKAHGKWTPIIEDMITNYLELIAENKYSVIAKKMNMAVEEVQRICDLIKSLDPKPGRNFGGYNDVKFIVPDVIVRKIDGEYFILINDFGIPRPVINSYYQKVLREIKDDRETENFLRSKLQSAIWLIKSIEQRRETLYRVSKAIVEYQREFIERGIKFLKPLTLKDIAERVQMHESTVSRAINGKYIQIPRGIYPLKYFFTTSITSDYGGVSAETIKNLIREIIQGEDPYNPYSDQYITELLNKRGIKISRRTVAKYREELNIPSSLKRKRY